MESSQATMTVAMVKSSSLETVSDRIHTSNAKLASLSSELAALADRILGGASGTEAPTEAAPIADGRVAEISARLAEQDVLIDQLKAIIERLSSLG